MEKKVKRKLYLKEFRAISHALSTYEELPMLVNHIVEGLARAFKIKGCCIMLYDEREKQLPCVASFGISDGYLYKGPVFVDERYSSFFTGKPVFVNDLQNDPRMQYPKAAAEEGFVALVSFPIKCRKTIVGLVRFYHDQPVMLHEEDVESISILTLHLGLVIENNGIRNFLNGVKDAMENLPLRMLKGLS